MELPTGYQLLHLAQVDSTNAQAARLAGDGVKQAHWIIADEQTAGRGRHGRHWVSPVGNLMTTLYLPRQMNVAEAGNMAFIAGIALADTVAAYVGEHYVSLKWPNDVLVDGGKISGILLETSTHGKKLDWVAVGMGLNLVAHPNNTPYPATSIKLLTGKAPDKFEIVQKLAYGFDRLLMTQRDLGLACILSEWRKWAQNIGEPIGVRLEKETLHGIFEDIDDHGALLLRLPDGGKEVVSAGDVFFPELVHDA